MKKAFLIIGIVLFSPVLLFLFLTFLLYLPPVQNAVVQYVTDKVSEPTGMQVSVGRVLLSFPLDLCVEGFRMQMPGDSATVQKRRAVPPTDTIAEVERMQVSVRLLPLLRSRVVVDELLVNKLKLNTAGMIESAVVRGTVDRVQVKVPLVDLSTDSVRVTMAAIDGARLRVTLADSVPPDTTTSEVTWRVAIDSAAVTRSEVHLSMLSDSMQVGVTTGHLGASGIYLGLAEADYRVRRVVWHGGGATYDNPFVTAVDGLDANHLKLSDICLGIDSIRYCNPVMSARLRYGRMKEKSGLQIAQCTAPVDMDSLHLTVPSLTLRTPFSHIEGAVQMDLNVLDSLHPGRMDVRVLASLGREDILPFCQALPAAFHRAYPYQPLMLQAEAAGNMKHLLIRQAQAELPTAFRAKLSGDVFSLDDLARLRAHLSFDAATQHLPFVTALLPADMARTYHIPYGLTLRGTADADGPQYSTRCTLTEGKGRVQLYANANIRSLTYQAQADIQQLNVHHFMPRDSIYTVSAHATLYGRGTDMLSPRTQLQVNAGVDELGYGSWNLDKMALAVALDKGVGTLHLNSDNQLLQGAVDAQALISKTQLAATVGADITHVDMYALGASEKPLTAALCAHADMMSNLKYDHRVQATVNDLTIRTDEKIYRPTSLELDVLTTTDTTCVTVNSGDFLFDLDASGNYDELAAQGQTLLNAVQNHIAHRIIDEPQLRALLPTVRLNLYSGEENPLANFLRLNEVHFKSLQFCLNTSPQRGFNGNGYVHSMVVDSMRIDTISFLMQQRENQVNFSGRVCNNRRNPQFVFTSLFDGYLLERGARLNARYYDASGELGAQLGVKAEMADSGLNVHLLPYRPVLGYKEFQLNEDNYLFLGNNKKLHAKIDLIADDGTGVKIYSEDNDSTLLQDLTVSLNQFDLDKITSVIPYAPRIGGLLNGDFHVVQDEQERISVMSDLNVAQMSYEHCAMGDIGSELVYMQRGDSAHYVEATLNRNGLDVGRLLGSYKAEGDGYLDAVFSMNRLPLSMVNGFFPDQIAGLEGYGEGDLKIVGPLSKPVINGEVYLDSSYLVSVPYGMRLRFDNDPVRIVGSRLLFENFSVYAYNDSPLIVQGEVNFANLERILVNMKMKASNFQIVNAKEQMNSIAYGKAFVNFNGSIAGELDNMRMDGQLDVLGKTDVAYILRDSPITTDNQLDELVKFRDFSDTTQISVDKPAIGGFVMNMRLNVSTGAHIMAYLNADHSNYIDLTGGGMLQMNYSNVESIRLNGRYTLSNGQMKYALPVIPLKTFSIQDGSYVEFTGDPFNPRLNITAQEETKATVSGTNGVGRSVKFISGIVITKTLNDMGLEFTLDAPEDLMLHNELQTMSAEQRGKLAVTMLTTGMYLADGNTETFSMNNALSSFLNSEINQITGNALRSVDLSVGMSNTTDATGTTHTDYSFKFAKRFWNNRLKITVGGKTSTGDEVQSQNKSFFDNVMFEYRLDDTANKYLSLFYNNSTYDWLDGYTQEYGAGFIWKKTLQNFNDLFKKDK